MPYALQLTERGVAAIADAITNGTRVTFAAVALSSNSGEQIAGTADNAPLPGEVWRNQPTQVSVESGNVRIRTIVPATTGGWTIRGVGIFDSNSLLAFADFPQSYKPVGVTDDTFSAWTIDCALAIGADAPAVFTPTLADWLRGILDQYAGGNLPIKQGTVPIAASQKTISIQFDEPFSGGNEPVVTATVRIPQGGDFLTAAITSANSGGFSVTLSSAPEEAGYALNYIALEQ